VTRISDVALRPGARPDKTAPRGRTYPSALRIAASGPAIAQTHGARAEPPRALFHADAGSPGVSIVLAIADDQGGRPPMRILVREHRAGLET
jgi:hypothetical protein